MIVNVIELPVQVTAVPVNDGVTVIVATTGTRVAFTAVNDAMSPEPLAARPMLVLLFVHVNVVPATLLPNTTAAVELPLQTT